MDTKQPAKEQLETDAEIRLKMVSIGEILNICRFLGMQLHGIPQPIREPIVARLFAKHQEFVSNGNPVAAMAFAQVAQSFSEADK